MMTAEARPLNTPWLSDAEVDDMCDGLINDAAKCRYLRRLGLTVNRKPNGKPLVVRAHAATLLSGLKHAAADEAKAPKAKPNRDALVLVFGKRATA